MSPRILHMLVRAKLDKQLAALFERRGLQNTLQEATTEVVRGVSPWAACDAAWITLAGRGRRWIGKPDSNFSR